MNIRLAANALSVGLALLVAIIATDAEQLVPRVHRARTYCCCAETGVDARCTCTGSCCRHEASPAAVETAVDAPDGQECVSPHCARPRDGAPGVTSLDPGTPVPSARLRIAIAVRRVAQRPEKRASQHGCAPPTRPPDGRAG